MYVWVSTHTIPRQTIVVQDDNAASIIRKSLEISYSAFDPTVEQIFTFDPDNKLLFKVSKEGMGFETYIFERFFVQDRADHF